MTESRPLFVCKIDCHRPPVAREVVEKEPRHVLGARTRDETTVIQEVPAQDGLQNPAVGIAPADRDRFKEEQNPSGRVLVAITLPADLVHEFVAERQIPERSFPPNGFVRQLGDYRFNPCCQT